MTTRDEELQKEVQRIVDKYDQSVYKLSQYATAKEFKTVMKYVADFANRRQREIAGLEPTETKWKIVIAADAIFYNNFSRVACSFIYRLN